HPVVPGILRYRNLSKVISTYCSIPDDVDEDGRLRVEYNQLGAETGRMSSRSVIQTLPRSDEWAIRRGFVAGPGNVIVQADFNHQELRVLANESGDAVLQSAIRDGTDLHGLAAVKTFGLDCQPNEVKQRYAEERDRVKAIQFGIIYGRGAQSLADELGLGRD